MEQYDDLRVAGRGAYSVVRLVRRKRDGMLLCMKRFHTPLSELSPRERAEVAQEIKLLAHLRHPNIIRFEDNFIDDTGSMNIVMEYAAGGTLSLSLANRMGQYLPEDRIWEGFVQLLSALRYVHSCNVLHRDLKTQNILLAGPQFRTLKLGDFGIAKVLGSARDMAATVIGTPHYLSPELCQGQAYDTKSDIWALGCVLYEMCCLKKAFDASNMPAIIFAIMRGRPDPLPQHYSAVLKAVVDMLLQPAPADRPSLLEIEALPIVQHHLALWRETRRRLEEAEAGGGGGGGIDATPSGSTPTSSTHAAALSSSRFGSPHGGSDVGSQTQRSAGGSISAQYDAALRDSLAQERAMIQRLDDVIAECEDGYSREKCDALVPVVQDIQQRVDDGPPVSGRLWERIGRAWADVGHFADAIAAYRNCLRAKSGSSSVIAMEHLGNLLVRRAQQVWYRARGGDEEGALALAQEVLPHATALQLAMRSEPHTAATHGVHDMMVTQTLPTHAGAQSAAMESAAEAERSAAAEGRAQEEQQQALLTQAAVQAFQPHEQPAWHIAASALMFEGLAYIERMCSLGSTPERRALLGSAYKRRAWTGLGTDRRADLRMAAANYAAAHALEMEERPEHPSPYARLNQLLLEMLATNGNDRDRMQLIEAAREAEEWAASRKEEDPADLWLWIQAVEARCLRYLLGDDSSGLSHDAILAAYKEQLAFGTSERIKATMFDCFAFAVDVLHARIDAVAQAGVAGSSQVDFAATGDGGGAATASIGEMKADWNYTGNPCFTLNTSQQGGGNGRVTYPSSSSQAYFAGPSAGYGAAAPAASEAEAQQHPSGSAVASAPQPPPTALSVAAGQREEHAARTTLSQPLVPRQPQATLDTASVSVTGEGGEGSCRGPSTAPAAVPPSQQDAPLPGTMHMSAHHRKATALSWLCSILRKMEAIAEGLAAVVLESEAANTSSSTTGSIPTSSPHTLLTQAMTSPATSSLPSLTPQMTITPAHLLAASAQQQPQWPELSPYKLLSSGATWQQEEEGAQEEQAGSSSLARPVLSVPALASASATAAATATGQPPQAQQLPQLSQERTEISPPRQLTVQLPSDRVAVALTRPVAATAGTAGTGGAEASAPWRHSPNPFSRSARAAGGAGGGGGTAGRGRGHKPRELRPAQSTRSLASEPPAALPSGDRGTEQHARSGFDPTAIGTPPAAERSRTSPHTQT